MFNNHGFLNVLYILVLYILVKNSEFVRVYPYIFCQTNFLKFIDSNQIFSKNFSRNFVVFNLVIKSVERVSLLLKTLFILKIQKIPARYLGHCNIKKRSGFISEATSKDTFVWKEWLARIFEKLYFGGRSYDCPKQEDIHNLLMCFRKLDLSKH